MSTPHSFNIRVYGLLINPINEVLITDEYRLDMYMTKFPGGGLEYGEGTIDCLKREFKEELNINIEVKEHFYTTDYFQKALSFKNMQLLSIYYIISSKDIDTIKSTCIVNEIPAIEGNQSFRWINISQLNTKDFTFPIDKKVVELLKERTT